jgi:UDP-N-acetylglucosamine--N-acetylmuramyl-(pentapeptide) pyrophosphoryl-undecaprenol N-acetylglucosamine transferase
MKPLQVVFAAGGTAGHIEPALNVADVIAVESPNTRISFIGSSQGLENRLVPQRGYSLATVNAAPFPRAISRDAFTFPFRMTHSIRQARSLIKGSDVVVGFGGYPAAPAMIAAHRLGIPLVIHEANARAGLVNRMAARWTPHIYACDPRVLAGARKCAMPLRSSIAHLDRGKERRHAQELWGIDGPAVLVFGGSQGAHHLNAVLAAVLPDLLQHKITVIHSYGMKNEPPQAQPGYVPVPYIEDMAQAYAAVDTVVARAGAMTCAEVTAVGMPAIFIPLPIGNGEQRLNAMPIAQAGGAVIIDDGELTQDRLLGEVLGIMTDDDLRSRMSDAAQGLGSRDSSQYLANEILTVARDYRSTHE